MLAADGETRELAGPLLTPLCEWCGSDGEAGVLESDSAVRRRQHLERAQEMHRQLSAMPNCSVDALVVRPLDDGYCLQGTVVFDEIPPDLEPLVRQIAGANPVQNHLLLVESRRQLPR